MLVLVRHGESLFNKLNLFTGWVDVPLTKKGIQEARQVATHCQQFNYDSVFTSHLERAHETLLIILSYQQKIGVFQHSDEHLYNILKSMPAAIHKERILPIYTNRALNERLYGDLQGMNKKQAGEIYGASQVFKWRRGFKDRPPQGESLKDTYKRAVPYFKKMIVPRLKKGESILVVSHGNTLRTIIKHIENITDDKIPFIHLPLATPIVYAYNKSNHFKRIEGTYNFERRLR